MTKFSDLKLDPKVLSAVEDAGYTTPTPIQEGAIPPALEGRDVLGIAQTGTGKTASFTLPMITLLKRGRAKARMPRSLVLAPTRELAAQVAENFDTYAKNTKLTKALLIGGVSFKEQDTLIDRGVDVLIATPGRLLDHVGRGKLILTDVKIMVVDEADRMLDMGFIPDIEQIFKLTPFTRQTLFFSATMAPEIERITNTFLSNPAKIEVARAATAGENIKQGVVMFSAGGRKDREGTEKRKLLRAMIEDEGAECRNGIIFCNRKVDVDTVAKSMKKYGLDASPIHGDLDQSKRTETLGKFRDGTLRFLVASDVAARGLDIPNVSHVFNYDVPSHAEDYVHRIGRTGRAGKTGTTMMICVPRDEKNLQDIERLIGNPIPRLENPMTGSAPASAPAPAPEKSEDAPKKTRSRSRKKVEPEEKSQAEDTKPQAPAPQDVKVEENSDSSEDQPKRSRSRGGRGRSSGGDGGKTAQQDAAPPKDAGGRGSSKPEPKSKDSGRGGNRGGGKQPVGMGDDAPDFIAKSFAERYEG